MVYSHTQNTKWHRKLKWLMASIEDINKQQVHCSMQTSTKKAKYALLLRRYFLHWVLSVLGTFEGPSLFVHMLNKAYDNLWLIRKLTWKICNFCTHTTKMINRNVPSSVKRFFFILWSKARACAVSSYKKRLTLVLQ